VLVQKEADIEWSYNRWVYINKVYKTHFIQFKADITKEPNR